MLLTQSIILLHSDVDVANALHNSWSSNSAWVWVQKYQWLLSDLNGQEFTLEIGIPFGLIMVAHHRFFTTTLNLQPDLDRSDWFLLSFVGRQKPKFFRMWWFAPVLVQCFQFSLWHSGEGVQVVRCVHTHGKGRTNLYHCLLSIFRLEMKVIKSSGGMPRLSYTGRDDRHFVPTGLYIVRTMNGRKRESPLPLSFSLSLQAKSIGQACSSCNLVKN